MSTSFASLGLNSHLIATVNELGYDTPTPIQAALIPSLLAGRDVVGQAQTGTGKTAAFTLPMLHHLGGGTGTIRGLVLCPTRELAVQVAKSAKSYGSNVGMSVLAVYGGQSYRKQIGRIKQGVDVVVGTPGRLLDLINKGLIDLSGVEVAVLDEADEMLSMGFIDDIEAILSATPNHRQTAFFSATMSRSFERLASKHLDNPETCRLKAKNRTAENIEQRAYFVSKRNRLDALVRLLQTEAIDSAIVFARTRADTFRLADQLQAQGHDAGALNGEMEQYERRKMLNRFRNGQINVLVGTNVAARGLDIDHISHVFNYELPTDPEVYVHRVGRTGRAGKSGTAISLVPNNRRKRLRKIERYTKRDIATHQLPTEADVQAHRDAQVRAEIGEWVDADDWSREKAIVHELMNEGRNPVDIAAAALKAARSRSHAESEEASAERVRDSHEDGMVRLKLNTGRKNGTRPGQVVGSIAGGSGIPGGSIGKIDIQGGHTMIDVPAQYVDQVLAKSGLYKIGNRRVRVE
ncbi:DEAD/DEAH box helicase [Longibacter sp.]|jgi:ATP-dependent RNA helicase DeaD|uniref:DEAD/DEAH box helicase n=1 Tax=Longibacter sp. TaxID=2045415 RepID=UPI003EB9C41C